MASAPTEPTGCPSKIGRHVRPASSVVPDAAVDAPEIEPLRFPGHPRGRENPPAAERPQEPPMEILEQRRIDLGANGGAGQQEHDGGEQTA